MKNVIVLVVALLVVAVPSVASVAFHPTAKSCNRCHIVHNSQISDSVPLWSGQTIDASVSFTEYSSGTLDAVPGDPEGATLLCLSCHDASTSASSSGHAMNTDAGDMSRSHPMEFVYNDALAGDDGELKDPTVDTITRSGGIGGTIAEELLSGAGKVNCLSCHDVHVQGLHGDSNPELPDPSGGGDYNIPHLQDIEGVEYTARGSDPDLDYEAYSLKYGALCVTCHIK